MGSKILLKKERDYPLLIYVWRWKIVTTESIYRKFFPNHNPSSVYNRLLKLSQHGFLDKRKIKDGEVCAWTLGKIGYKVIKDDLPALREDGYKSENLEHDLYCSAAHQGDFLVEQPDFLKTFSEQQLRRYDPDYIPSWVPSVELHRPDGYWLIKNSQQDVLVSLELEKSRKNSASYDKLAHFYTDFPSHDRVLWITEGSTLAKFIHRNMLKVGEDHQIHNFVLLKNFIDLGWSSKIILGPEKNKSISEFIYDKACAKPVQSLHPRIFKSLLNTKLRYQNN